MIWSKGWKTLIILGFTKKSKLYGGGGHKKQYIGGIVLKGGSLDSLQI